MPRELSPREQEDLLDFLTKNYDPTSELSRSLRRLGYDPDADGIWAGTADKRENFDKLLEKAGARGWLCLLAFCAIGERIGNPGAHGLAESLFSPHLQAGLSLYANVLAERGRDLTQATISACFREAGQELGGDWEPALPSGGDRESLPYIACWLACAEEEARDARPLSRFARALHPHLGEIGRRRLEAWWEDRAAPLGLGGSIFGGPKAEVPASGASYAVLVELKEAGGSSPKEPVWVTRAWLQRRGDEEGVPLDQNPIGKTRTPETMPDYLKGLLNELEARKIPLERVAIQFFVERDYLACNIDRWKVPVASDVRSEIGFEIPVVLRALDREPWTRKYVRRRWLRLKEATRL
jgi:hypothetical protein